jgi:hypothetical protein
MVVSVVAAAQHASNKSPGGTSGGSARAASSRTAMCRAAQQDSTSEAKASRDVPAEQVWLSCHVVLHYLYDLELYACH